MSRSFCYRCSKPAVVCICERIVTVDNKTGILILQHKCERSHHVGTARIATLGLKNVEFAVVWPDEHKRFTCSVSSLEGTGLLYPSEHAVDLAELDEDEKPERLVVLDGSWADAHSLYKHNPWLWDLPHYKLNPEQPGRYRIRKEPNEKAVSTIEAIVQCLQILEPQTERLDTLLDVFDSMIDDQIRYLEDPNRGSSTMRYQRPKQKASRAIPRLIKQNFTNVVVAYGESVPLSDHSRVLISWTALRLEDGALFERYIFPPPDTKVTDQRLKFMGLNQGHLSDSVDADEFKNLWDAFSRPDDVLLTWNTASLDLFENLAGKQSRSLFLKDAYCNARGGKCGHLQDVVEREALATEELPLNGRAQKMIAEAAAVARFLNELEPGLS